MQRKTIKAGRPSEDRVDVEKRDQYGRLSCYLYVFDGRMLNEEILEAGYANLLTYPPNMKYQERFLEAYRDHGFWR